MASLFVDNLTVIDFSYLDAQRGIVGESWIVDLELGGALNAEGMVFDFGHVKKAIKAEIDRGLDHRFVIPLRLEGLEIAEDQERTRVRLGDAGTGLILDYCAPNQAFYWLDATAVTPESALADIRRQVLRVVPANVTDVMLSLRTEAHDDAYYHYSHGLKKHAGDCQRMVHGHRSRIVIEQDGQRRPEMEQAVAADWRDVYLATREDIQAECRELDTPCYAMAYQAAQGRFELTLPVSRCDVLETDTTVELIASHLASRLSARAPQSHWRVRAFEGVDKGALAQHEPANRKP